MPEFVAIGPFGRAWVSESDECEGWVVRLDGSPGVELCESKEVAIQRARVLAGTIVLR